MTDSDIHITITFDFRNNDKRITLDTNFECEWKNTVAHEIQKDNRSISINLVKNEFNANNPLASIITPGYVCFKGENNLPIIQKLKSNSNSRTVQDTQNIQDIQNIKITYKNVSKNPILVSGFGLLATNSTYDSMENISGMYRRCYTYSEDLDICRYKNVIVCFSSKEINPKYNIHKITKRTYKTIKKYYKYFDIANDKITVVSIYKAINSQRCGGRGDILGGCFIYFDENDTYAMSILKNVIYHETYHALNPGFNLQKQDDSMWFKEGFCEYYYRLIKNNGSIKEKTLRKFYKRYIKSPCNGITLKEWLGLTKSHNVKEFNYVGMYPYYIGFVYANYLHNKFGPGKYIKLIRKLAISPVKLTSNDIIDALDPGSYQEFIVDGAIIKK